MFPVLSIIYGDVTVLNPAIVCPPLIRPSSMHYRDNNMYGTDRPTGINNQLALRFDLETNGIWLLFLEYPVPNIQKPKGILRKIDPTMWLSIAFLQLNLCRSILAHVRCSALHRRHAKSKAPRFSFPYARYPKPSHCHADVARLQWTPSTLCGKETLSSSNWLHI